MSYQKILYKNSLEVIREIYEKSKYNPDVDLYRSFDILNSINENQIASKEWLVEKLVPFIDHEKLKNIAILGSWYGLTGMILRDHVDPEVKIYNIDMDDATIDIGKKLQGKDPKYEKNYFRVDDAGTYLFDRTEMFDLIINTSCEHMDQDDIDLIIAMKRKNVLVCFQGNNYHEIQSHINTHNSLDEFIESLDLVKVLYKESLRAPNGKYDRYMVIGI